ncbi:hypothetical protein B0H66DRAFT_637264 [Apodospora peruviana]|uniref:C2 domain-containing protein n=1 Tax=Apodospora peruviana TaxID=516989 RepID=A0AAE0IJF9_9PEZI|nr:hypothetical protein B0H66DRAFT_637264 [Apodospora peruviana]
MTTKVKTHPLNGMHTAGIFSDMTVDGPQIGTLVLVVDRAKNLPNRKTIGKQDPYCAARLGKEAKKTNTDIRGGQTPKWQVHLLHDSPDYYQLKVSVFNDDKRTDLIGEAWIDLRDIIVSGGGQSDQWHQLTCRGKYAGEVRIEITFYDSRPKPEKPVVKAKKPASAEPEGQAAASPGATGPRAMPKRRPLPSDPVTGKAPASPSPGPEQVGTPPRPQPNGAPSAFIPNQSPLQQLEYNTPPPGVAPSARYQQQQQSDPYLPHAPSGEFGIPSRRMDIPPQQYRTPERVDKYSVHPDDRSYSPHYQQPPNDRYDPRSHDRYDLPQLDDRGMMPEDDRPPPPPAHRSRTGSNPAMNATYQSGFDLPAKGTPPTMRHDVLRSAAHRQSASTSYPGRPTYKAYDSAPGALVGSQYSNPDQPSPPRHYSYDSNFDPSHRAMQATVEDVPESPDSLNNSFRRSGQYMAQPEPDYDMGASPAPLSLGNRGSAPPGRYSGPEQHSRRGSNGYVTPPIAQTAREASDQHTTRNYARHSESSLLSYSSQGDQRALTYRSELDDTSNGYAPPPVPPSLVPGMDPSIAQKISERFHHERNHQRRYTQPAAIEAPHRGRTMSDIPRGYDQDSSQASYSAAPPSHSRSPVIYSGGQSNSSINVVMKPRAYSPNPVRDPSPNPQHTIRRKSVSPAPPPAPETRRLSGVPFGPDSYDALNPSVVSSASKDAATGRPDYNEASGKIITHDGREVDPEDHLPMETWAPEPEPRDKKSTSSDSFSGRPSPSQPLSGRRPLHIAGRPQSVLPSNTQYALPDMSEPMTPSPPVSTGRNRLQKKAHRASTAGVVAAPPVMSGANSHGAESGYGSRRSSDVGSSPLAPLPPHQDNFTPPRQLPRASTFDSNYYSGGENHSPYGGGNSGYGSAGYSPGGGAGNGGRGGGVPPVPAKVPLALPPPPGPVMSGALQLHSSSLARRGGLIDEGGYDSYGPGVGGHDDGDMWGSGGGGGGGGHWSSLEEEMQRIDIGTGRSRRRGY